MNALNKAVSVFNYIDQKTQEECWPWIGRLNYSGYGQYDIDNHTIRPHRLVYELSFGPIPDGLEIMHTCHNRACCNPNHLRAGTHAENMRDKNPYKLDSRNSSGAKGVYWNSVKGKWYAQAFKDGRRLHLYSGFSYESAVSARKEWEVANGKNLP